MDDGDLWHKWKRHYQELGIQHGICRDGIIDPERFQKARLRVLIVLMEANMTAEDRDCDLRTDDGCFYAKPWTVLKRWATGILHGFPPFAEIEDEVSDECFRSIAVI